MFVGVVSEMAATAIIGYFATKTIDETLDVTEQEEIDYDEMQALIVEARGEESPAENVCRKLCDVVRVIGYLFSTAVPATTILVTALSPQAQIVAMSAKVFGYCMGITGIAVCAVGSLSRSFCGNRTVVRLLDERQGHIS